MTEESNIKLLNLSRIINDFVMENKEKGWYAPDLAKVIIENASPSSDKVREILIRHFEPVDVDEKVDFAYSLTTCVNEICGGIE